MGQQATIERTFRKRGFVLLVLRAFVELLRVDMMLRLKGFPVVRDYVQHVSVNGHRVNPRADAEISRAVDLACVFYFKEVRCLQRSAAAVALLRKEGLSAEMVIGVQTCPYRAHAWVELSGRVVNDKSYAPEMYVAIDRC